MTFPWVAANVSAYRRLACYIAGVIAPLLFAAFAGAAPGIPEQFSATFSVEINGIPLGKTHWSLQPRERGRFLFESVTTPNAVASLFAGKRREHSIWSYHHQSLRPISYRYRDAKREKKNMEVTFDWQRGVADVVAKGRPWKLDLPPHATDKLLYLLTMMHDLHQGRTSLEYTLVSRGKLKAYKAQLQGKEELKTELGRLETLRVQRDEKRKTTIWFAPTLAYLPVRVEHEEKNGDLLVMEVQEFTR